MTGGVGWRGCVCGWLVGWSVLVCAFVCAFVSAFVCSFRGLFACVLSWVEIYVIGDLVPLITLNCVIADLAEPNDLAERVIRDR